jgi:hypothetical protein
MKFFKNKLFKEPLFHFLIFGGLIYTYYQSATVENKMNKNIILVSKYDIKNMNSKYQNLFNKKPDEDEFDAFIKQMYFEEILLNEAYSLGLHKEDKEITSKLLNKMNYIITHKIAQKEPSEDELYEYYKNNIDDYSKKINLTFSYIHIEDAQTEDVKWLLKLLNSVNKDKNTSLKDGYFTLKKMKNITKDELSEKFGKYFAQKLFQLKKGNWNSEVYSKTGSYLVYVDSYCVDDPYSFDEIEHMVYRDYIQEQLLQGRKSFFDSLQNQYILKISKND